MALLRRSRIALVLIACCAFARSSKAADLRTVFSEHYAIHTDLDPELSDSLARRMDAMWEEYARRLADFPLPNISKKFDAYLFTRKVDYMRLTGDRFPNTGGIFNSDKRLLAAFLEGQGRDGLRQVLQHEAFHQFAFTAVGPHLPVWLNEGLAQIFEEGIWTGDRFLLGQIPPRRLSMLQSAIAGKRLVDFKQFLATTDEQWLANMRDKSHAVEQYNQAWAMAQFLVYARDDRGNALFVDNVLDMLHHVHHGCDGRTAFEQAFSDNYAGFQRLFNEWASRLSPSTAAIYTEQQTELADMMVELYGSGKRFVSVAQFRDYLSAGGYLLEPVAGRDAMPAEQCFYDVSGNDLTPTQLFFSNRSGAPTPDLVYRPTPRLQFRTRFLQDADALSYETTLETP